jgi:hypothetical protein
VRDEALIIPSENFHYRQGGGPGGDGGIRLGIVVLDDLVSSFFGGVLVCFFVSSFFGGGAVCFFVGSLFCA